MTNMLCFFLDMVNNFIMTYVPEITLAPEIFNNFNSIVDDLTNFISAVNFMVPLPDIILIFKLDIAIRIVLVTVFAGNWVVRRVFDVIP